MPFFQKKPIIVEAARVTSLTVIPAHQTLHQHDLIADPGDWIIKGVKGEFYPCKDDVFRETYNRSMARLSSTSSPPARSLKELSMTTSP
jgi:hypothetical protein